MRSKASVKGHAIHAALIPFPLAFLFGAPLFDLLGILTGRAALWTTAGHLAIAGVAAGVIAAVPGVIDYVYTVPPNSTGRKRATRHMLVNTSALALVAIAWLARPDPPMQPDALPIALQLIAAGLLAAGGWLGGTLVSRNQIGVDHRYANKGKWKEASLKGASGEWVEAARADELQPNQMKLLRLKDRRIVLARTEHGWVAFDDRCTHRGGSLAGGTMICGTVQCPWHGSQFEAATGAVKAGPATQPIGTYPTQVRSDKVGLILP